MAEEHVDVTELLSKPWQKFFAKFEEVETLKVSQWKDVHLLAYFCKRYESHYGKKFAFSFKGAPSKCTEVYMMKKLCAMLNTTNKKIVKQYIDWIFDQKIIPGKLKIRSIGYITTNGFGNEFNLHQQEINKIGRSTELPIEYKEIADTLKIPIVTYGDLAFIKMAIDQSPNNESRAPYHTLFSALLAIGFEPSVLNNLV